MRNSMDTSKLSGKKEKGKRSTGKTLKPNGSSQSLKKQK